MANKENSSRTPRNYSLFNTPYAREERRAQQRTTTIPITLPPAEDLDLGYVMNIFSIVLSDPQQRQAFKNLIASSSVSHHEAFIRLLADRMSSYQDIIGLFIEGIGGTVAFLEAYQRIIVETHGQNLGQDQQVSAVLNFLEQHPVLQQELFQSAGNELSRIPPIFQPGFYKLILRINGLTVSQMNELKEAKAHWITSITTDPSFLAIFDENIDAFIRGCLILNSEIYPNIDSLFDCAIFLTLPTSEGYLDEPNDRAQFYNYVKTLFAHEEGTNYIVSVAQTIQALSHGVEVGAEELNKSLFKDQLFLLIEATLTSSIAELNKITAIAKILACINTARETDEWNLSDEIVVNDLLQIPTSQLSILLDILIDKYDASFSTEILTDLVTKALKELLLQEEFTISEDPYSEEAPEMANFRP